MSDESCALPENLKERKHNDWPWPASKIARSWNAYGPRCPNDSEKYRPWPPRLVEGHGVARWESNLAQSIIEIPALANRTVLGGQVYGREWQAIERNPGRPDFGQQKTVVLGWREMKWAEIVDPASPLVYSPSALQKFSPAGWMKLTPDYSTRWKIITRREQPDNVTGDDTVLFYRRGYRPDHFDVYYNKTILLTAGLRWE